MLEFPAPDPDGLDTTMVKGYVLIRLLPGLESDALQQIRAIPGVRDIILVFGG